MTDRVFEGLDVLTDPPPEDRRYEWEPTFLLRRLRALHLEFTPAT